MSNLALDEKRQSGVLLAGRILLSFMFVVSGIGKATSFTATAVLIASAGLPAATFLTVVSIMIEIGCGAMLALGWKARWAALLLFLFIIPVTLTFHAFWAAETAQFQSQFINFMKNCAIMGGMLYVFVVGAGRFSLDAK